MNTLTGDRLSRGKCVACEGGVEKLSPEEIEKLLESLEGWEITPDKQRIRKKWKVRNFIDAMGMLVRVARVAENEGHHPDLHLEQYRNVRIELWTHAVGGLSRNDFILAAKIDEIAQP